MRTSTRFFGACALGYVVALSTLTSPARADDDAAVAQARKEYAAGKDAYSSKRYAEAALHFEAAAASRPHAVTLYTAALAWEAAGKPERAADAYSRSLDVPGLDQKQQDNAHARLAALEAALGTLTVKAPDGTRVQLDALTETTTPAHLHASPGIHTLSARMPGDKISRKDIQLDAGQATPFEVKADAPTEPAPPALEPKKEDVAPAPAPPPPAPAKFPMRRAAGFGVAGLGVGVLTAGVVLGFEALSAKDAYNAGPTKSAFDHANSLATWSTISFVAGTLFTAGGVALILIPDKPNQEEKPPAPAPAPTSASARLTLVPTIGGAMFSGAF